MEQLSSERDLTVRANSVELEVQDNIGYAQIDALTEGLKSVGMMFGEDIVSSEDHEELKSIRKGVQKSYRTKFAREVDIHHKIAYRFEKAYRLRKKMKE